MNESPKQSGKLLYKRAHSVSSHLESSQTELWWKGMRIIDASKGARWILTGKGHEETF